MSSVVRDYGEPNRQRVGRDLRENNHGRITLDWESADPSVTVDLVGVAGEIRRTVTVPLSELRPER